ncbi:MAG TPA: hypothetical protein PKD90_04510 [Phnomibacter sp.]|nr:hypothetical protein [Phnomibacter sp.]
MNKYLPLSFLLLLAISQLACRSGRQFGHPDVATARIRSIAILPAHVVYTGHQPKHMQEADWQRLLNYESRAYSEALHQNLLRYSERRRKIGGATLQSPAKTHALLQQEGLSWQEVAEANPDKLAQLLGVDAVVTLGVHTNKIMSDAAAMVLGSARQILFGAGVNPAITQGIPTQTGHINASASLVFAGNAIWTANYQSPTHWQQGNQGAIAAVTRRMGRGFPY